MKKPEWLFVAALLLVGAYFSYKYFSKQEKFNPLQLVPKSSVAVYAGKNPLKVVDDLRATAYWQDLLKIEDLAAANRLVNLFDSLITNKPLLTRALRNNQTLISLHVTGSESAGLMFYLPTGVGTRTVLEQILQARYGTKVSYLSRVYYGFTIHELKAGEVQLSYINHKNYIVLSTVGYLVEDVIRNLNNKFKDNFLLNNKQLQKVARLQDDAGDLYIDGGQLSDFYQTLLPPRHPAAGLLAKSMFMDIAFSEKDAFLSGFLFSGGEGDLAGIFRDQEASFPGTLKLVPDDAALVMSVNVTNAGQWYENWQRQFSLTKPGKLQQDFSQYIKGDITRITFNAIDKKEQDILLLIKLKDKEGMLNLFNKRAESIAAEQQDTVYFEQFAGHTIGLVDEPDFVAQLLGKPFAGFAATYFMLHNDYLVLASTAERIKKWLTSLSDDRVWGKSVFTNSFIDENLGETSFTVILNNPWGWGLIAGGLNEKHRQWWQKQEVPLKQFGLVSFQFTNLDNRFYTAVSIQHRPQQIETGQQELTEEWVTQLTNRVLRQPKLVRNHRNNLWEVLVQDSTQQLILLDNQGEILWQDPLPGAIVTPIHQIDFFRNKKLQYLFATDSVVYLIDRNGEAVEGFPVVLDYRVKDLVVIDYDHSKNYRYLISDYTGNLRMYDQYMAIKEGWDPLAYNSNLSNQIFHVRVRGKDRIVIGLENGLIDLRNRRAEEQPGFPLDIDYNLENPLYFHTGTTFASSRFTTLSTEGLAVEFDLLGKEYARNQLYQPTVASVFSLIIDPVQHDYVIVRQDLNRLAVLARDGEVVFEKDYQADLPKEVKYYSFAVDKQLYVVRNTATGQLYLYNKDGNLINADDLYSDYPVSVIFRKSQAKCYIFTVQNQTIAVKSFAF